MKQYQDLIHELIQKYDQTKTIGGDRTGVGTVKKFGHIMRFDLAAGFPMVTVKHTPFKAIVAELLWFLRGSTDNTALEEMGCKIWHPWAVTEKDLVLYYVKLNTSHESKYRDLTPTSEVDWGYTLQALIGEGLAPHDARKHLGQLGPIYSKSWVDMDDVRVIPGDDNIPTGFEDMGFEDGNRDTTVGARVIGRSINQVKNAVNLLKTDPNSRRILVNAWDARYLPEDHWPDGSKKTPQENVIEGRASLAYCHAIFQFATEELTYDERLAIANALVVSGDRSPDEFIEQRGHDSWAASDQSLTSAGIPKHRLNCMLFQRSVDSALGLPFNIASYALLTQMMAHVCNMVPGDFVWTGGDVHLYANQLEPMRAALEREPLPLPKLWLNPNIVDIFDFDMDDIQLEGYQSHEKIKMDVAV